jgi:hypothetical protein
MTYDADRAWFLSRTAGAPETLRERAEHFFSCETGETLTARLASAGSAALAAATHDGATRRAALDLLAADALITLALLASAERNPEQLGAAAAALRAQATLPA